MLVLASVAPRAEGADWRDSLPEGWLAAVEVLDLAEFDQQARTLTTPWDRPTVELSAIGKQVDGLAVDRPWGVAVIGVPDARPTAALYAPIDDFERLCDSLDAERGEDLAIVTLLGQEFTLLELEGYAQVTLLSTPRWSAAPNGLPRPPSSQSNVSLTLSPEGLSEGAARLGAIRRDRLQAARGRLRRLRGWPENLGELAERLSCVAPIARVLASVGKPITFGLDANNRDELVLHAHWQVATPPRGQGPRRLVAGVPIAQLATAGALPLPIIRLALAVAESSPVSLIEAAEFPQPQWDDFAEAAQTLIAGTRSPSVLLTLPGPDAPLAANQAIAFDWPGTDESLGDAIQLAVIRWNVLMATARGRSPMRLALEPSAEGRGWLVSVDVLAAAGRDVIPEERQVLQDFYGDPDRLRIRISPRGEGWLASTLKSPVENETAQAVTESPLASGEFDLARWFNWDERIKSYGLEDAIGRRKPTAMDPQPAATLSVTAGEALRVEAVLPRATYEAAVRYGSK